jgi:uncharacterized protein
MVRPFLSAGIAALSLYAAGAVDLVAAEPLPQKPAQYVTDRAGILSTGTIGQLNDRLAQYERDTSNQVLIAIFPTVPDGYEMNDFANQAFRAWGVGQKDKNNGIVLFVFSNDHKMRIEVGYGLEGALPDATAMAILDQEIKPAFRAGNFDDGVTHGVNAILAATRGEYKGSGQTDAESESHKINYLGVACFLIFVASLVIFGWIVSSKQKRAGGRRGRKGESGWWSSSGGSSSGSSSDSDFSGGGGSSGGGGASGSW